MSNLLKILRYCLWIVLGLAMCSLIKSLIVPLVGSGLVGFGIYMLIAIPLTILLGME